MHMRSVKTPSAAHPITLEDNPGRVVVTIAGRTAADSRRAITLREATIPPVQYIPLEDVDTTLLAPSDHTSYCPFKGEASYYSIPAGGERSTDAVWQYREPYDAVARIRDHVAFYPSRVDAIDVRPAGGS